MVQTLRNCYWDCHSMGNRLDWLMWKGRAAPALLLLALVNQESLLSNRACWLITKFAIEVGTASYTKSLNCKYLACIQPTSTNVLLSKNIFTVKNLRWKTGRQDKAGPYAYSDNQWVGYDDPTSIKAKVKCFSLACTIPIHFFVKVLWFMFY